MAEHQERCSLSVYQAKLVLPTIGCFVVDSFLVGYQWLISSVPPWSEALVLPWLPSSLLRAPSPRILLVTSAFHMRRAQHLFERQGLQVLSFSVDCQVSGGGSVPFGMTPLNGAIGSGPG